MPARAERADGLAETQEEERRLLRCFTNVWPVIERKPMRTASASRRAALSFDNVTGVAAVELVDLMPGLEAVHRTLVRLGSAMRAVTLHIARSCWSLPQLSARILQQADAMPHSHFAGPSAVGRFSLPFL